MESKFILSCESTVDLPFSYVSGRNIPVLFYNYTVNGMDYEDVMGRDPKMTEHFYRLIDEGNIPSTSQINAYKYREYFTEQLKKGDVLHVVFGTGMTGSYYCALEAAKEVKEQFPDRKLVVLDSTCSCGGYGILVDDAADMRDKGAKIEEVADWIESNKLKVQHRFYSTTLKYFSRTGRVSVVKAKLAGFLNICPLMALNREGKIEAFGSIRGKKNAIRRTVNDMLRLADGGSDYNRKCLINHSNCPDDAAYTKTEIIKNFPRLNPDDVKILDIGTIIAAHCGPGTVAIFFYGAEEREKNL